MKALLILICLLVATDAAVNQSAMTMALLHGLAVAAHNFQHALSGSIFAM